MIRYSIGYIEDGQYIRKHDADQILNARIHASRLAFDYELVYVIDHFALPGCPREWNYLEGKGLTAVKYMEKG